MGESSKIEWTHHTFNPWRGCTKVSPGCTNCYAETMSHRNPGVLGEWGPNGRRVVAAESYWRQPLKWDREAKAAGERRRVFCASLADVFEDKEGLVAPRMRLFNVIEDTDNLDWLLLTKRPENIERFWPTTIVHDSAVEPDHQRWMSYLEIGQPTNVWVGTSVEDQQRANERIPALIRGTNRMVRFLSVEPLLGPVDLTPWLGCLDWVIVGGESGPRARPCDVRWIQQVVRDCEGAGVPVFVKQLGAHVTVDGFGSYVRDRKGGDPAEWPADLCVREFPITEEAAR